MTPRETLERMARALCEADSGYPDDPVWQGLLPTCHSGKATHLVQMMNEWAPAIYPLWATYVGDARRAAVAAGLMNWDDMVDFDDIPQWELVKKEAKDQQ